MMSNSNILFIAIRQFDNCSFFSSNLVLALSFSSSLPHFSSSCEMLLSSCAGDRTCWLSCWKTSKWCSHWLTALNGWPSFSCLFADWCWESPKSSLAWLEQVGTGSGPPICARWNFSRGLTDHSCDRVTQTMLLSIKASMSSKAHLPVCESSVSQSGIVVL